MASFIQNYIGGMVQNAAMGAATYAITTGGRVVGDVVIGAGDLIEGAGRNVGNSVEGYIDRYGNWIRSYGDGAIAATAASSGGGPNAYRTAVKPAGGGTAGGAKQKAIGGPNKPGTKALPAPKRPGIKKSASDTYTPPAQVKALPASGVKKALPAARGGAELSKGQLAKARGIKAEDLKKSAGGAVGGAVGGSGDATKKAVPSGLLGAKDVGVASKPGRNKRPAGRDRKPAYAASSAGGSEKGDEKKSTPGAAMVGGGNGVPTPRTPAGGPKPFSAKRPDGKVVVSKESRPGAKAPGKTAAGSGGGGGGGGGGAKPKDEKGGVDFMRLMAEEPKKKGPGSVAGSVKTNGTARKAGGGGGDKGGKQETSGKYDFF